INDILDLSKIESGIVALEVADESFLAIRDQVERSFRHVADSRGLEFKVRLDPRLAPTLRTDAKRLQQVLKNLLSNAFKFTERGRVELRMRLAESGWSPELNSAKEGGAMVAIDVVDTGIGIPSDKQRVVFEAFQQSDGTTSRKYGGTGLGLSISRELVRLLGGEIRLTSTVGVGSTFTVYLPVEAPPDMAGAPVIETPAHGVRAQAVELEDDRDRLQPGDAVVLIVDDDVNFCRVLLDLAHQEGFKGIVALGGKEALALAREYRPSAVTLDIGLGDISGWKVLDALSRDPATRAIPVPIVTVFDDGRDRVERAGARFLTKPATRSELEDLFSRIRSIVEEGARHLLVVEDSPVQRAEIVKAVSHDDVVVHEAATVEEARAI